MVKLASVFENSYSIELQEVIDGRNELAFEQLFSNSRQDSDLREALFWKALRLDIPVIVKEMIKTGTSVNIRTSDKSTPLHIACKYGSRQTLKVLLKYPEILPFAENKDGYTPLHIACERGDFLTCKELLKVIPNVNVEAKNGETPLFCAVKGGWLNVVELLLASGATCKLQLRERGKLTYTLKDLAKERGYPDIYRIV